MTWQPNKLEQERLDKAERLQAMGVELYPRRADCTHSAQAAIAVFEAAEAQDPEAAQQIEVTVCGRIRRVNIKGKVSFMHIEDGTGRIQLFLRINDVGEAMYQLVQEKLIEMDDYVQATGTLMRTKAGEISVRVSNFTLLSKALSPLPVIKQQTLDDGTLAGRAVDDGEGGRLRRRRLRRRRPAGLGRGVAAVG
jgi:lysyl-tRNA synthetase class 2